MADSQSYTISVPEQKLQQLRKKLDTSTFPDELDEAGWDLGAPLADVKALTRYWREKFDWRKQEAELNQLPNYTTSIKVDGFEPLDIHFIHKKSEDIPNAIPLLFCHGWPGSFVEVTKLLSSLTSAGKDVPAFHVVAPSLPNYGFSSGTSKRGFGLTQYAETCHKLMLKLGYNQYVTQGGDWGSTITRFMGYRYPQHVKASHINMVRGHQPSLTSHPLLYLQHALTPYTEQERRGRERTQWFFQEGSGYSKEQGSKPQTLGYAFADSPVALLAWMYEKLHDWTDEYPWTPDEILTWVSIYLFSTAGPAANIRIYYEVHHDPIVIKSEEYIPHVKLGLAYFPKELMIVPKTWGRTMGPVVFESQHDSGGHFAAWEKPGAIVQDLRQMFGKDGGAYKAVEGKDGYIGKAGKL